MPRGSASRGGKPTSGSRPSAAPRRNAHADLESRQADIDMVDGTLEDNEAEDVEGTKARIPDDLLTRILHEFFQQEDTRMSKAANRAVGKYFEIFVQEAIARTAQEKDGRFLEVEDLEKITPQLIMDL
ncbi:hypothetical protein jhhlp_001067 [Lomentospora prolificans]|uniref:Centromere protein X n=1 Tax=Lomentospora prolificans TaxID=41688 RepID=A0A2N3NH62_9PEZI|nr:hypothetical protein jhhlp_001067 [Lomentospora prolificans]